MASSSAPKNFSLNINIGFGGVSITQVALFAKAMAVMMNAGIAITDALVITQDSVSGSLKNVLGKVFKSVESGRSLSDSLGEHPRVFSTFFVNTVRVGESSGTLAENLVHISEHLEKQRALLAKIKGVMVYPVIILTAVAGLGIFVAYFILPKILPLFTQLRVELPFTTKAIIWIANLFQQHGLSLLIGGVVAVILTILLFSWRGFQPISHWFLLHVPGFRGLTMGVSLAMFCQTLGILLRSGLSIDGAMDITQKTLGNYYYRQALTKITASILKGTTLAENLARHEHLFPKLVTKMVHVGEQSGKLDETLIYLADYYEQEVDAKTKALPSILEPVLLLGIGLMVGFLALAIMTPIFKLTSGIRR